MVTVHVTFLYLWYFSAERFVIVSARQMTYWNERDTYRPVRQRSVIRITENVYCTSGSRPKSVQILIPEVIMTTGATSFAVFHLLFKTQVVCCVGGTIGAYASFVGIWQPDAWQWHHLRLNMICTLDILDYNTCSYNYSRSPLCYIWRCVNVWGIRRICTDTVMWTLQMIWQLSILSSASTFVPWYNPCQYSEAWSGVAPLDFHLCLL